MSEREKLHGIVLIHEPVEEYLNARQRIAYREHRRDFIDWLETRGKEPDAYEGYARDTYYVYANVVCQFHRYVWDKRGFTLGVEHDDARNYMESLLTSPEDYSSTHLNNSLSALKAYFRWSGKEWDPDITLPSESGRSQPRDFVTKEEREALRNAVLEYGTIPAYAALDPEERAEWKRYLARRYGMSASKVGREEGLAAAQAQLRHKDTATTMKYDQAPPDDRRDALDRM